MFELKKSAKTETMKLAKTKAKEIVKQGKELAKNIDDRKLKKEVKRCAKMQAKTLLTKTRISLFLQKDQAAEGKDIVREVVENIDTTTISNDLPRMARKLLAVKKTLGIKKCAKMEVAFGLEVMKLFLSGSIIKAIEIYSDKEFIIDTYESIAQKISMAKMKINFGDICIWIKRALIEYNTSFDLEAAAV